MEKVTVDRNELLEAVRANRDNHRAAYEEAHQAYIQHAEKTLSQILDKVRSGRSFQSFVQFNEPQDHTRDYNRVIKMLEMSTENIHEISARDFDRYVMDRWEWSSDFATAYNSYTGKVLPSSS